jgi:hypothetical protein
MKLSELRPCDVCGGGLLQKPGGPRMATFYVLRISQAMPMPAADRVVAMSRLLGDSLQLGEVMADVDADDAIRVFGDKDRRLMSELLVCFDCMPTPVLGAMERRADAGPATAPPAEG